MNKQDLALSNLQLLIHHETKPAWSAGAVEYTNCFSAEG